MQYFGIKTPVSEQQPSYIWWIADSSFNAWMSFFTHPSKSQERNAHRLPLAEAIEAYKAIGYTCVELDVTVKTGV